MQRVVAAAVRKQRQYLAMNGIDPADARQEIICWLLEHQSRYDAARGAWSTWVTDVAAKRILDLARHARRKCRRLPAGMVAPAHEAENLAAADAGEVELLRGMSTEQMIIYLMAAGRGLKRGRFDGSPYPPQGRMVTVFLCGRLSMGPKAMAGMLRDNRLLCRLLGFARAPNSMAIRHWQNEDYQHLAGAVKTLKLSFR
jgi:hypothetical protein